MNLLDLMSTEYRGSRRELYAALAFGCAVYAVVVSDALLKHSHSELLALVAFVLQSGGLLMKHFSSGHYGSAEEIRRIAVLKDGLGVEPTELEKAEIASRIAGSSPPKRIYVGKYYTSDRPQGTSRLLEDVEESAFWTQYIARLTGWAMLVLVLAGVGLSVFALVALVVAGLPDDKLKIASEAVVITLGFVVAGEFLILSLQYLRLSDRAAGKLATASFRLDNPATPDREAALLLFGEYNCALAGAPPLPMFVYGLVHKKLTAAWSARKSPVPVE